MHFWKKISALTLTAALTISASSCGSSDENSSNSSTAEDGEEEILAYDSNFTISVDEIAEAMGAGWNLGNQLEANSGGSVNETVWGNPEVTQELITAVADAGFQTIRVPVSYLDTIDDDNGYTIDSTWLDRVEEVVQYCYNEGLYVIINVHGDGYNTIDGSWFLVNGENQDYICEKYEAVWQQIAERFADYDEHLIFESMNEEFDNTYNDPDSEYYANLNTYNQIFVDTVRATGSKNTHRWLLVPGWNTDITYTVGDYGFEMPTDENCDAGESRLMLSVHYYTPWDYCGEEDLKTILWGDYGADLMEKHGFPSMNKVKWGEEDYLDDLFQQLYDEFVANDIPVIIGEYGCIDKSAAYSGFEGQIQGNRAYFNGYVAGKAAELGMIPVYWDNGYNGQYGFGLFNRTTYEQTQPEIIATIIEAVENKDPLAGIDTTVTIETETVTEAHAYIGIQTAIYTFRNAVSDSTYGIDSGYFDTLIKWGADEEIIDTGATFEDATITEDGIYTVNVSGYDFSSDCDSLNMLFVSTDFTYTSDIDVTDVVLKYDDNEIAISDPLVMSEESTGNLYIELINIYNTDLAGLDYSMPTDSFSVTFTITGMDSVLTS
ncbi:MAG: glycoside hydrolase family 5 protein [Ruminococcus sp.]|nr:glycoside hydrolase family 5 protein [Ruminococcus sp.]